MKLVYQYQLIQDDGRMVGLLQATSLNQLASFIHGKVLCAVYDIQLGPHMGDAVVKTDEGIYEVKWSLVLPIQGGIPRLN